MMRVDIRAVVSLAFAFAVFIQACSFDSAGLPAGGDEAEAGAPPPTPALLIDGLTTETGAIDGGPGSSDMVSETGTAPETAPAEKKAVCHKGKTLEVDSPALKAHLAHGDTQGPCPPM